MKMSPRNGICMAILDKSFNSSVELQACAFAELHCLSNYSFLRGASHPEELVKQAKMLGYKALALTDECTYAGLVKAHIAAKDLGIKLIVGSEFEIQIETDLPVSDKNAEALSAKVVLLAPDRATYGQLSAMISKLRRRADKGEYAATLDDFRWGMKGCLALWVLPVDQIGTQVLIGETLKTVFPELWIALELFRDGHDLDKTAHALTLSMRLNLPIVAANDVHTHQPERQPLQDLLTLCV